MEGKEILAVVDSVSSEKGLEKDVIFVAMELAIASASQRHFHEDAQLLVEVDRESGEFITKRKWVVLDENDEEFHRESHISPSESSMEIGELYSEQVDNVAFGRIETQAARQVMLQKVREAEKELVVSKFISSDNKLVSGFVKRVTRDNIIVDLGQDAEAILPRDQILPGEIFKINDRVRAVLQIKDIEGRGLQLMLSRICKEIVTELFRIEVPEVNEDVIEIRGVARDPGSRSKIAVKTNDGRIDPVGACVGMRGSRVQSVSGELQNERIDIIIYEDNPAQMVINALQPAKIESIVLDEENHSMELAVNEDNLALAIGARGQNIRLASKLVGWELNIISSEEAEAKEKLIETEFQAKLIDSLSISENEAELLVEAGMKTFDEIAYAEEKDLKVLLDSTDEKIEELKTAASDAALIEAMGEFSAEEDELASLNDLGLSTEDIDSLKSKKIKNKDDIAELSVDELKDLIVIDNKKAAEIIMKAREGWFK